MPCVFWPLLLQYELMTHTALGRLLDAELLLRIDEKYRGPGEIFFHAGLRQFHHIEPAPSRM